MIPVRTSVPVTRMPARRSGAHEHVGWLAAASGECPPGVKRYPIALEEACTGTGFPLAFSVTEALPSVSSSVLAVSVGIASPVS